MHLIIKDLQEKYFTWVNLKKINSYKFINSMYIWLFIVPVLAKLFEKIDSKVYTFKFFGEMIPLQLILPFSWSFFYISAILFALANLIFILKCPLIIKDNNSYNDFQQHGKEGLQLEPYIKDIDFNTNLLIIEINKKINFQKSNPYPDDEGNLLYQIGQNNIDNLDKITQHTAQLWFWGIYKNADIARPYYRNIIGWLFLLGFCLLFYVLIENFITTFKYMYI